MAASSDAAAPRLQVAARDQIGVKTVIQDAIEQTREEGAQSNDDYWRVDPINVGNVLVPLLAGTVAVPPLADAAIALAFAANGGSASCDPATPS